MNYCILCCDLVWIPAEVLVFHHWFVLTWSCLAWWISLVWHQGLICWHLMTTTNGSNMKQYRLVAYGLKLKRLSYSFSQQLGVSSLFVLCDLVTSCVQHLILLMNVFLLFFQGCHFDFLGLLMILFTHLLSFSTWD